MATEKQTIYLYEELDRSLLLQSHGEDIARQFDFINAFIKKSMQFVQKNFEFILYNTDVEKIVIRSGRGDFRFLATYDDKTSPKIRRFLGNSDLKPVQVPFYTKSVNEATDKTFAEVEKEICSLPPKKCGKGEESLTENKHIKELLLASIRAYVNEHVSLKRDAEFAFFDADDGLYQIHCGDKKNKLLATFDSKGIPMVLHFVGEEYSLSSSNRDLMYLCEEINARTVGKLMLKVCGNEGVVDDKNSAHVRRVFQAVITNLENEKLKVWKNAEMTIYDKNYNAFIMRAGNGHHKFLVNLDGHGEIAIV